MKDKIIKYLLYPVEFLIATITVYLTYRTATTKVYQGFWERNLLVFLLPCVIILIAIIIFNCIKNKEKIEKIYLGFMIPIGLFYMVFMGLEYTPDESAHLWKSYEISQGEFITHIEEDGNSDIEIPKVFYQAKISYKELNEKITQQTDYNEKMIVNNPAQNYNPILYLFSSIGLLIGKIIGMNGFLIQFVARMMNYIAFLVFSYFSIKKIPFGKLVLSAYFFMPMLIHQAISISADSLINSVILFYIAYNLYLLFKKESIQKYEIIAYIALSICVVITKIVYFPLIGMSLLFIFKKDMPKRKKQVMIITSILLTILVTYLWYGFSFRYTCHKEYLIANNINSVEQIKYILTHPIDTIKVLQKTISQNGTYYLLTLVGSSLGGLDISVSTINIIGIILAIVLSIFFEKNEMSLSARQRLWLIAIVIVIMILILLALYVGWTRVGGDIVEGVQGRYFIPIAIIPLLCCIMKENYVKIKNITIYIMLFECLINLNVIKIIFNFFI